MVEKRYVFESLEVKLTGRKATKQAATTRRTTTRPAPADVVLVEITPANIEQGSWKKWVKESELFAIIEEGTTDEG